MQSNQRSFAAAIPALRPARIGSPMSGMVLGPTGIFFVLVRMKAILVRDAPIRSEDPSILVRDGLIRVRMVSVRVRDPLILSEDPRILASPKAVPTSASRGETVSNFRETGPQVQDAGPAFGETVPRVREAEPILGDEGPGREEVRPKCRETSPCIAKQRAKTGVFARCLTFQLQ